MVASHTALCQINVSALLCQLLHLQRDHCIQGLHGNMLHVSLHCPCNALLVCFAWDGCTCRVAPSFARHVVCDTRLLAVCKRHAEAASHGCVGQLARQTERALRSTGSGEIDFEKWYVSGLPLPLIAACAACQRGVKRAHLVDARMDGALLLELYSRDGVGTMLSADFYEVPHVYSLHEHVYSLV